MGDGDLALGWLIARLEIDVLSQALQILENLALFRGREERQIVLQVELLETANAFLEAVDVELGKVDLHQALSRNQAPAFFGRAADHQPQKAGKQEEAGGDPEDRRRRFASRKSPEVPARQAPEQFAGLEKTGVEAFCARQEGVRRNPLFWCLHGTA